MSEKKTTYSTNEAGQRIALIRFDCPPDVFDLEPGQEAYVMRRKRVPVWKVDAIKVEKNADALYQMMAEVVPEWTGVCDTDTGELLPMPKDDHMVFSRIDLFEQWLWIASLLQVKKKNPTKSGRGRT